MAADFEARILCIDDDDTELSLTKLLLENAGYRVLTARNPLQALELLSSQSVDLVLSDYLLCGMTGAEAAKRIKASYPEILVVLFSGLLEPPQDSAECTDMFICKDGGPTHMLDKIAALIAQQRSKRRSVGSP